MRTALTLLCLIAVVPAAQAGGYLGASFISTDAEFDDAVDSIAFDSDDDGWKIFLGFPISRHFDIEASYRELGTFSDVVGTSTLDAEIEALQASLRLHIPLGKRLEIFGTAGYADIEVDGGITGGSSDTFFDGDWELVYGVGAGLNFGAFGIRAEWEKYDVDDSLNSFSAGAYINF